MIFRQAHISIDGKTYPLQPGRANSFEELYVDFARENQQDGNRYTIFLHPKQPIRIQRLELEFNYPSGADTRFFTNGYQSWSESRARFDDESLLPLRGFARRHLGAMGDDGFDGLPRGPGRLHSWTYTWLKTGNRFHLAGSLDERTGYTLFFYHAATARLTIRKDLDGLQLDHSFPALDVWMGSGRETETFDRYFALAERKRPGAPPLLGWTSRQNPARLISKQFIDHNLKAVSASGLPFTHFLIDDGWQTAVGDWLSFLPAFSDGPGRLAADIREQGLQPGLWLAPFVAAAHSEVARRNPDWLLKGPDRRPLRAGWNPLWKGWFYALDFYHPGARDYLSGLFHTVFDRWNFSLVKLDFLFAAALAPPAGKTRGQVMFEVMEFLRQLAGPRQILASGVPLGPCFGLVDYCRVSSDRHDGWANRWPAWLRHRERVSTLAALRSTLGRWQLGGRAFGNDPGLFTLRAENHRLTTAQRHTLLTINALLGQVLFTSDDVALYQAEQRARLEETLALRGCSVQAVNELQPDVYRIDFNRQGELQIGLVNLTGRTVEIYPGKEAVRVMPFETRLLVPPAGV